MLTVTRTKLELAELGLSYCKHRKFLQINFLTTRLSSHPNALLEACCLLFTHKITRIS